MADTVLTALATEQLKRAKRQDQGRDRFDTVNGQRNDQLKAIMTGQALAYPEETKAQTHYYALKGRYLAQTIPVPPVKEGASQRLWGAVADAAKRADLDVVKFIDKQFEWYHDAFRKVPEPHHMHTDAAVQRATLLAGTKEVKDTFSTKRTPNRAPKKDLQLSMSQADRTIRDLMRANKATREEVYKHLVIPGHVTIPSAFLAADPAYKRALK